MPRTFAIGDIHGGLRGLTELLEKLQVNKEDRLIFLGDYVDGWSESAQVIDFLITLREQYDCVFIKGNHDAWCEEWLRGDNSNDVWRMHGGQATVDSYEDFSEEEKAIHLEFFERMPMYFISEDNRLFVHAGFTSMHGVQREVHQTNFYYDRTLWEMALTADKRIDETSAYYPSRLKHYKEIYIGHTPTINFKSEVPMQALNVCNVDTGAAFTGRLSAINIDTKEVFQSEYVYQLYPNEVGRNSAPYRVIKRKKAMKYNNDIIQLAYNQEEHLKFLFFWGHRPNKDGSVGKGCFSQWWESEFTVDAIRYKTAEHFMMAEKARLFEDEAALQEILQTDHPFDVKKVGRRVSNFRPDDWDDHKFNIVVKGNYAKFSQNEELKQFLLNTKNRVLVEASPHDKIWGIGMDEFNPNVINPYSWRGQNLLGYALMEVRDMLREE